MNDKKVIIIFIIATILIIGGGVYILAGSTTTQNAKVSFDTKVHDWGTIPYGGGNVSKIFTIKNTGSDILKLTNIKTSCMCTKAYLEIDGITSPAFGMHDSSSWVGEVLPGGETKLNVVFDPTFHGPTGVGPVERLILVETNDANNSRLEFSLKGVVVK